MSGLADAQALHLTREGTHHRSTAVLQRMQLIPQLCRLEIVLENCGFLHLRFELPPPLRPRRKLLHRGIACLAKLVQDFLKIGRLLKMVCLDCSFLLCLKLLLFR